MRQACLLAGAVGLRARAATTRDPFAALTELPDQADSAARCPLSLLFTYIRDLTASTAGDESIRPLTALNGVIG
jgi:hypothetical protein